VADRVPVSIGRLRTNDQLKRRYPTMGSMTLTPGDREALRTKYEQERQKRLRPDGPGQYLEPTGQFSYLREDPYTPWTERQPITDHVTVVMVGGGFAGLCVGARLREAGIDDFRIIESGGDFGGVWYWNRYPGAMCDTAAMIYMPLLEETGYLPTQKYAMGPEILAHAQRIGRHYDLYDRAVFSTQVTRLGWDDDAQHWVIESDRGDRITAKYLATGMGPLDRPKLPGIPGLESFGGHSFHTSRWDWDYTGGDQQGAPMSNLADKRVGVIGTGATAVQCVPSLGRDAGELLVFQRTPSAIDTRNNEPLDPERFSDLGPGWQREWLINFGTLFTGQPADVDLVADGWTAIGQRIRDRLIENHGGIPEVPDPDEFIQAYHDTDDEKMTELRRRVDEIVGDPEAAAGLKAWYRQFCKRPCFHDEYLDTFNRATVHLVDTDGRGVERVDETGVWVGDQHFDLDCIVYASGFEFGRDYTGGAAIEIVGRHGLSLRDEWKDGMESFQGMFVHGFPNLFVIGFRQGMNMGANVTSNYTEAGITMAAVVKHAEQAGATEVEVTEQAQGAWVEAILEAPEGIIGGPECTPGYYNTEGEHQERWLKLMFGGYPLGPVGFLDYIDEWRSSGSFDGLEIRS
jgi:cation diffusion facilitator CzcD-associated flavoprotein CzcO